MDFEPHNFPALVASVIRSDPTLAEPLKEIFAAYARNEDLDERWSRIDGKFHHSLRLILEDLNEIDDPISLDQEIQVLLYAIDEALMAVEEEGIVPLAQPRTKAASGKSETARKKTRGDDEEPVLRKRASVGKKKAAGKKKLVKKKAAAKKTTAKKKTPVKKKAAGKKTAGKKAPAKKAAAKKKTAVKKTSPAKKTPAQKPKKKAAAAKKSKPTGRNKKK